MSFTEDKMVGPASFDDIGPADFKPVNDEEANETIKKLNKHIIERNNNNPRVSHIKKKCKEKIKIEIPGVGKNYVTTKVVNKDNGDIILKVTIKNKVQKQNQQREGLTDYTEFNDKMEFKIHPKSKIDNIKARLRNGLLSITIPKEDVGGKKGKVIDIDKGFKY